MKPSVLHLKSRFTRKKLIESFGILFAVCLAAILGNYVAHLVTSQMDNALIIYVVGILIGLVIGLLIGVYFKRGWSKLFRNIQE
jgi:NhaP-type Na+/H+ or K+/H+ antiporter